VKLAAAIVFFGACAIAAPPQAFLNMWSGVQGATPLTFPVTNGLLHYYRFEDTLDSEVNAPATLTNTASGKVTVYGDGKFGRGLYSEETNRSVWATTLLTNTYPYSMAVWVNSLPGIVNDAVSGAERRPLAINRGATTFIYLYTRVNTAVDAFSPTYQHRANTARTHITTIPLETNVWFHMAITSNSDSNYVAYYNGDPIHTNSLAAGTNLLNQAQDALRLVVGANIPTLPDASSRWWGSIDEVAMWGRELSPAEIKAVYEYVP
jgi:hypothetical protein